MAGMGLFRRREPVSGGHPARPIPTDFSRADLDEADGVVQIGLIVAALACLVFLILPTASPAAAPLDQACIAVGTVAPIEVLGDTFNHHPERKREAKATDTSFKPFEIESGAVVVLPRLPAQCINRYRQLFRTRLQYKSTTSGGRWHSMSAWHAPTAGRRAYEGPTQSTSFYTEVGDGAEVAGLRNGCATASRLQMSTSILDEGSGAIIARRTSSFEIPVDAWYQARCMGRVSIRDLPKLKPCGSRARGSGPGALNIVSWNERAKGLGCRKVAGVAQAALEAPEFSEGLPAARVEGWQCYFPERGGVVDCIHGDKRVYLVSRHSYAERCKEKSPLLTKVSVLGTSCDAVGGIVAAVAKEPRTALRVASNVDGVGWSCSARRALGYDDRMANTYHCFAPGKQVCFNLADSPERSPPAVPEKIPPQVQLPAAGTISLPRAPDIKFFYEPTYGNHKITIPLEVEPALRGRRALVKIKIFATNCVPLTDGESRVCNGRGSAGQVTRHIILKASNDIAIHVPHQGDWVYLFTVRTAPFTSGGIPFTTGIARRGASYFN